MGMPRRTNAHSATSLTHAHAIILLSAVITRRVRLSTRQFVTLQRVEERYKVQKAFFLATSDDGSLPQTTAEDEEAITAFAPAQDVTHQQVFFNLHRRRLARPYPLDGARPFDFDDTQTSART